MNPQFEMLRKKMERFNAWEAENRRKLSLATRLEQFIILYDLAKRQSDGIQKKMHEDHLESLVKTCKKLRDINK